MKLIREVLIVSCLIDALTCLISKQTKLLFPFHWVLAALYELWLGSESIRVSAGLDRSQGNHFSKGVRIHDFALKSHQ